MTRQIRVDQIDDVFRDKVRDLVTATTLEWTKRVKKATPVRIVYKGEPKGGGQLRAAWQTRIDTVNFRGLVFNNVVYSEPVCFGVNKPPSWGGVYRTNQNTVEGFPELIGKELEQYVIKQLRRGI